MADRRYTFEQCLRAARWVLKRQADGIETSAAELWHFLDFKSHEPLAEEERLAGLTDEQFLASCHIQRPGGA